MMQLTKNEIESVCGGETKTVETIIVATTNLTTIDGDGSGKKLSGALLFIGAVTMLCGPMVYYLCHSKDKENPISGVAGGVVSLIGLIVTYAGVYLISA